ncbi:MAG: metal ABC transporter substrate-binding protein [Acidimicrobiia bacterium]
MQVRSLKAALLVWVSVVASCSGSGPSPVGVEIVVTNGILGDLVANVVGEEATVEVLVPMGVDPHEFEASSAQVALINRADLVVANGLGLEAGLADVLATAVSDGVRLLEIAPLIDPIPFSGAGEEAGDQHEDGALQLDPHVWMDPVRMARAVRLIAAELASVDPGVNWKNRAVAYADLLAGTDAEIAEMLEGVPAPNRKLVTNHATFGYFAARYGWEIVGTVIPGGTSMGAPSSAELAALVTLLQETGVRAIFTETTGSGDLARVIAAEVGSTVEVVTLHTESLGPPGSGADTLIGMLLTNARLITDASGGAG